MSLYHFTSVSLYIRLSGRQTQNQHSCCSACGFVYFSKQKLCWHAIMHVNFFPRSQARISFHFFCFCLLMLKNDPPGRSKQITSLSSWECKSESADRRFSTPCICSSAAASVWWPPAACRSAASPTPPHWPGWHWQLSWRPDACAPLHRRAGCSWSAAPPPGPCSAPQSVHVPAGLPPTRAPPADQHITSTFQISNISVLI